VGLTSSALPYLLTAGCLLLLAGIIVAWPRLAARRALPVALRVVSLCLLQVLVLGLIFVTVNRSQEFYASWADLFGSESGSARIVAVDGSSGPAARPLTVTGHAPVTLPGRPGPAAGTLQEVTIHGQLSGLRLAGQVYLPAGYRSQDRSRRYPVLVVISGAAGDSRSPYAARRLAQSAAVEMAAGRLQPLIMVLLRPALARDRACLNVPPAFTAHRPVSPPVQGETFFAQDVPAALQAAYPVTAQPAGWALLGDASGGYCALQLALDNSAVFSAVAVPPANYSRPPGAGPGLGTSALRHQDSLVWQLSHLPMQPVSVLFAGPGPASRPGPAQPFIALARPPLHVSVTRLAAGAWPLGRVLDWIGAVLAAHAHPAVAR
jgi:enterochelin esterase-like enzyme